MIPLLVRRYGRVGARLIHTAIRYNALDLHHCIELLACLLELLLGCGVVGVWTHCTHSVSSSFLSNDVAEAAGYSGLVLNFDVDWVVLVNLAAIWYWALGAGASLHAGLAGKSAHLAC